MSKFGELIDQQVPVLLVFHMAEMTEHQEAILRKVARAVGQEGRIIKIDVEKNLELARALRVKDFPTLMIYKKGEMCWRQAGEREMEDLPEIMMGYSN